MYQIGIFTKAGHKSSKRVVAEITKQFGMKIRLLTDAREAASLVSLQKLDAILLVTEQLSVDHVTSLQKIKTFINNRPLMIISDEIDPEVRRHFQSQHKTLVFHSRHELSELRGALYRFLKIPQSDCRVNSRGKTLLSANLRVLNNDKLGPSLASTLIDLSEQGAQIRLQDIGNMQGFRKGDRLLIEVALNEVQTLHFLEAQIVWSYQEVGSRFGMSQSGVRCGLKFYKKLTAPCQN